MVDNDGILYWQYITTHYLNAGCVSRLKEPIARMTAHNQHLITWLMTWLIDNNRIIFPHIRNKSSSKSKQRKERQLFSYIWSYVNCTHAQMHTRTFFCLFYSYLQSCHTIIQHPVCLCVCVSLSLTNSIYFTYFPFSFFTTNDIASHVGLCQPAPRGVGGGYCQHVERLEECAGCVQTSH